MAHNHLAALKPLRVEDHKSLGSLLDAMAETSFGGREVGQAWRVLSWMMAQQDLPVVLTISGAMTVAKMGPIFGSLISRGIVKAVVTTGALVTHSFVEELGFPHFKAHPPYADSDLHHQRLNRIYDTLEPEDNLEALENRCRRVFARLDGRRAFSSREIIHEVSKDLVLNRPARGLLGAAVRNDVPVYVPAFGDSELGMYLFRYSHLRGGDGRGGPSYDGLLDLRHYAEWLLAQERLGIITIGGGAPRNWAQQMLPFLGSSEAWKSISRREPPQIVAGVRICPDTETLGHLSGSTYSEGVTWGKFPATQRELFAEVHTDATTILPILAKALFDRLDSKAGAEEVEVGAAEEGD